MSQHDVHDVIAKLVPPGSRVLDLGCGNGALLAHLRDARQCTGYGIELDDAKVMQCVQRGVNVIQRNLEEGLSLFEDNSFDVVLQLDTLQHLRNTVDMLRETARVGKQGIVSFPNFAHWPHRLSLLRGRMPVSKDLPHAWYDTPNLRFTTLLELEELFARLGLKVEQRIPLSPTGEPLKVTGSLANLAAGAAVYVLKG